MSGAPDDGAAPRPPPYINRDGFKVADMEYYDLLAVRADATDLELKKAYRKAAIKNHPDKGGDEETFKVIGEAYRVLADNNLRADYDKHGKKKPTDEVGIHEATEMVCVQLGRAHSIHPLLSLLPSPFFPLPRREPSSTDVTAFTLISSAPTDRPLFYLFTLSSETSSGANVS